MKILLVTRGSQGDVLPYLGVARELVKRGHEVTVNLPRIFEETAKSYHLNYVLQSFDDISGLMADVAKESKSVGTVLQWTRDTIGAQFDQLIPLLQEHDILVATNTEFAATSVAEYCRKPVIRTAYAPFLPGNKIPPAVLPFPKPNPIFQPRLLWFMMNRMSNFTAKSTVNQNRAKHGLPPIRNFGHNASQSANNYMMYSRFLGQTDPEWDRKFRWKIGGYCFNDTFEYDESAYRELLSFIKGADMPVLFFTLGSCSAKDRDRFCEMLLGVCKRHDYRLVVGSGWAKTGEAMKPDEHLYLMQHPIPHYLIFPHCDALIHHGGSGTTHSAARAGKPQLITPLIIDQPYWAYRVQQLGVGPERVKISKVTEKELDRKICDLITNPLYKKNAAALGEQIQNEGGIGNLCDYIESFLP